MQRQLFKPRIRAAEPLPAEVKRTYPGRISTATRSSSASLSSSNCPMLESTSFLHPKSFMRSFAGSCFSSCCQNRK